MESVLCVLPGGVGETRNSLQEFCWDSREGRCAWLRARVPVGVRIVDWGWAGGMDWKAWIGRASKNSCAIMNGVLLLSEVGVGQ